MPEHDDVAAFVRRWESAGPAIARVRRKELRELTDADASVAIAALLDLALVLGPKVGGSGLVSQQRYFALVAR